MSVRHISSNDVVQSSLNPVKGELFERPFGKNIYPDCQPINSLHNNMPLEGHHFLYMTGSGAHSLLAMPDGQVAFAEDLIDSLADRSSQWQRLVILLDSP